MVHHKILSFFQSTKDNFPSWGVFEMISRSFFATKVGLNNLSSGTFFWNGFDKFVSVVPGWNEIIFIFFIVLENSIDTFLSNIFRLALEAL